VAALPVFLKPRRKIMQAYRFGCAIRRPAYVLMPILTVQFVGGCPTPLPGNGNGDPGQEAPLANFETKTFRGPANCALCHDELTDEAGANVSIPDHWRASVLANAAKDPIFLAKTQSEIARLTAIDAELLPVIEDACAICHFPMARTQALADGTEVALFNGGFVDPENPLHVAGMDGVSCTVCHQIQAEGLGTEESFSGEFVIDTEVVAPERPAFGPYANPEQDTMRGAAGYTPQFGTQIQSADFCASCHTLFTPTLNAAGEVVGTFPEQTPYLEWQHSSFGGGLPCQGCHLPLANGAVAIATLPTDLEARAPFRQHHFVGGNTYLLKMLRDHSEELEVSASAETLEAAIARSEAHVQQATAIVELTDSARAENILALTVEVSNLTGHKFPTGFPSRRAWLHLTVANNAGEIVFESGAWDAEGRIAGADADTDAAAFEPHAMIASLPDQVPIYESIMQNTEEEVTYTLLRAASYVKDNRLLPAGFDKETASDDIAVVGAALTDTDFLAGSDVVGYVLSVPADKGPFTISVELLYQAVSYRFLQDMLADADVMTDTFPPMFEAADNTPTVVDSDEATVP